MMHDDWQVWPAWAMTQQVRYTPDGRQQGCDGPERWRSLMAARSMVNNP
jgi:hypothetical protein